MARPSAARISLPSGENSATNLSPSLTPMRFADSAGNRTARLLPHFDTISSIRGPLDAILFLSRRIYMYIRKQIISRERLRVNTAEQATFRGALFGAMRRDESHPARCFRVPRDRHGAH